MEVDEDLQLFYFNNNQGSYFIQIEQTPWTLVVRRNKLNRAMVYCLENIKSSNPVIVPLPQALEVFVCYGESLILSSVPVDPENETRFVLSSENSYVIHYHGEQILRLESCWRVHTT